LEASVGDLDILIHSSQHHVDESDRKNRTSLHYAFAHNHPDVVTLLLENNSSINIRDDEGCTPLIKATQRDNVDCVSVLLTHNADPNLIDSSGNTALHHAISRGNIRIVKMLLEHNVDIEAKTEYGLTLLQLATFEQKPEMVEFLAAKCANSSLTPLLVTQSHTLSLSLLHFTSEQFGTPCMSTPWHFLSL
ncbi:mCG68187, partial [Mus musculus]